MARSTACPTSRWRSTSLPVGTPGSSAWPPTTSHCPTRCGPSARRMTSRAARSRCCWRRSMARFSAAEVERERERLVELRDTATGAWAHVWPVSGFNCVAAQVPAPGGAAGELVDLLLDPPALEDARREPSHYGTPLLWPFPSGMPRGEYTFEGRAGTMVRHGHGFALDRAWSLGGTSADETGAEMTGVFDSREHRETLEGFPFPYRLEATFRLDAKGLSLRFVVINAGEGKLPFGYGAHPYFKLPLGKKGSRGECLLHVPAARRWNGNAL